MSTNGPEPIHVVTVPGGREDVPDWDVVVVDGEPDIYVNAEAVAAIVRSSPLGPAVALARLRNAMSPEDFAPIEKAVGL